uniref:Kazal-like domain-containing protein n=1 Tax=Acrobeloides nanus TaxID=290746 RepID=A0A914BWJ7_9BILA
MIFIVVLFIFQDFQIFISCSELSENCGCLRNFQPVCGSDSKTYDNVCELHCAQRFDPDLHAAYHGTCCPPAEFCPIYHDPVCDNYGTTHENECIFTHRKCLSLRLRGSLLRIVARGNCGARQAINRTQCSFFCDERIEPVCDTLGKTHTNYCKFELTKCRFLQRGIPSPEVKRWGSCGISIKEIRRKEPNKRDPKNISQFDPKYPRRRDTYLERYGPFVYVPRNGLPSSTNEPNTNTLRPITITPPRSTPDKHIRSSILKAQLQLESAENLFELPERTETLETSPPDAAAAAYESDMVGETHFADFTQDRETTTTEYPFDHRKMTEAMQPLYTSAEKRPGEYRCSAETCNKAWDPICDTKNKTHKNECMFRFYACKIQRSSNEDVEISYKGECSKKGSLRSEPQKEIPKKGISCKTCDDEQEIVSVCDNMNQTHQSVCLLAQWNCERRIRGLEERVLVHIGHCHVLSPVFSLEDELCPSKCSKRYKPVCDTKGNTHLNLCTFQMVNCKERQADKHDTSWLDYLHECIKPEEPVSKILEMPIQKLATAEAVDKKPLIPDSSRRPETAAPTLEAITPTTTTTTPTTTITTTPSTSTSTTPQTTTTSETTTATQTTTPTTMTITATLTESSTTTSTRTTTTELYASRSPEESMHPIPATTKFMTDTLSKKEMPVFIDASTPTDYLPPKINASEEMKEIEIITTGSPEFECPEPRCEDSRSPICDNEGTVHKNECLFTFARCLAAQKGKILRIVSDEECQPKNGQLISINCTNEWEPVCGSDFITYPNKCILQQSQKQNQELEALFNGECEKCFKEPCPQIDPELETDDALFICDHAEETRTYCEFHMLQCIYELNFGKNLTESYKGRCCPREELCPPEEEPVCDSVGRTHKNKCHFEVAKCRREKVEQVETISIAKIGSCSSFGAKSIEKSQPRPDILSNFKDIPTDSSCEPSACVNTYEPVCGSDGKTYANMCFFKAKTSCNDTSSSKITVAYTGECCNYECTNEYSPICDNFGETHLNLCVFGKKRCLGEKQHSKNLTISSYVPCEDLDCDIECSQDYDPICGTDGKTYPNECMLKKIICLTNNIGITSPTLDYLGECCPDEECDLEFKSVCDSQGRTHENVVPMKNVISNLNLYVILKDELIIDYQGECCSRECDSSWKPVCDGQKTHPNICLFRIKQCEAERRGEVLSLAYSGECCLLPSGQCAESGSLCDSDGQTHKNRCYFEQKKCITEKVQPKHLSIVHSGDCCALEQCQKDEEPVCDNRGGTHTSLCHFQNTKCIHEKIHPNSTLLLSYRGACCENNCDGIWAPVCDQHGTVYKNKCLFQLRACEYDKRSGTELLQTPCTESQTRRMLRHLLKVRKNR